jgi:Bacterial conjugation TrbI-like protein
MHKIMVCVLAGAALVATAAAQEATQAPAQISSDRASVVIPAGTKVPLRLESGISTKNARPGDGVYARTTFPVTIDDRIIIPVGTYMQGEIASVKRAGRVHGSAEVLVHFRTMIYPSGYTVALPGALEGAPDAEETHVKGKEGTVQQDKETGKKVGTVAKTAGTGAVIGGLADRSISGAAIGGGMGAAVGTAIAMLTRGSDVRLPAGTNLEMVFERSVNLDGSRLGFQNAELPGGRGAAGERRRPPSQ